MNSSKVIGLKSSPVKLGLVYAAVLFILAAVGYRMSGGNIGKPAAPVAAGTSAGSEHGGARPGSALSDEQLQRMVVQTLALTQQDPKNASAWAMQAHSYEMMGKFSEAVKAYAQLAQLLPKDAQVLADYADALAVANGRTFKGEPMDLLQRALALDSNNLKALVLTGSALVEQQDLVQALSHFERARAATPDVALQRHIDASITQTRALLGSASARQGVAPTPLGKADPNVATGSTGAQVSGRVWLAEDLRAKLPGQAALFLYARAVEGSRMPVALMRKKASDLPLNFSLDDSMAMVPNMNLSTQSQVVVVARISLRGNVTPEAGDLQGVSAPVAVGTKDIKLEIGEVLK